MIDRWELWLVIAGLGLGSYAMRFVFMGLVGRRPLPEWALRHLRYTAVSIFPALVAPLVVWPEATGGTLDAPRGLAALAALGIGMLTRNVFAAMAAGGGVLFVALYWF
ncbi:branched-subunit amino acid transport protein [Primorskyibacter sedentarius]|uniref:Branched-subunit amino acid transport protein n=1 Tax=Primorskyibacter sedentarius TaxID=745311 RepID=A0A4R3JKI8_9RHOB|nr:AzlD domain-containing protein [Primorskyibacter sedentarius]TCS65430.1 branched-subunit amino acid transport protein [Primorskyibacter sedentarius]